MNEKQQAPEGNMLMQITRRGKKISELLKKFLSNGSDKVDPVPFFIEDWSDPERFKATIAHRV